MKTSSHHVAALLLSAAAAFAQVNTVQHAAPVEKAYVELGGQPFPK